MVFAPAGLVNTSADQTPLALNTQRFETPVTRWQPIYGWLASGVVLALVIELLRVAPDLSWPARFAFTFMIVLNTAGLSRIFEGRADAVKLEAVRCLVMLGPLAAGVWFYPLPPVVRVVAMGILLVSMALLFLLQRDGTPSADPHAMEAV